MYMFEKQLTDFYKTDITLQVNIWHTVIVFMVYGRNGEMNFLQQERWHLISTAKGSVVLAITVKIRSRIDASYRYMV